MGKKSVIIFFIILNFFINYSFDYVKNFVNTILISREDLMHFGIVEKFIFEEYLKKLINSIEKIPINPFVKNSLKEDLENLFLFTKKSSMKLSSLDKEVINYFLENVKTDLINIFKNIAQKKFLMQAELFIPVIFSNANDKDFKVTIALRSFTLSNKYLRKIYKTKFKYELEILHKLTDAICIPFYLNNFDVRKNFKIIPGFKNYIFEIKLDFLKNSINKSDKWFLNLLVKLLKKLSKTKNSVILLNPKEIYKNLKIHKLTFIKFLNYLNNISKNSEIKIFLDLNIKEYNINKKFYNNFSNLGFQIFSVKDMIDLKNIILTQKGKKNIIISQFWESTPLYIDNLVEELLKKLYFFCQSMRIELIILKDSRFLTTSKNTLTPLGKLILKLNKNGKF